jgi:hypothetical protein
LLHQKGRITTFSTAAVVVITAALAVRALRLGCAHKPPAPRTDTSAAWSAHPEHWDDYIEV